MDTRITKLVVFQSKIIDCIRLETNLPEYLDFFENLDKIFKKSNFLTEFCSKYNAINDFRLINHQILDPHSNLTSFKVIWGWKTNPVNCIHVNHHKFTKYLNISQFSRGILWLLHDLLGCNWLVLLFTSSTETFKDQKWRISYSN